jgi:PAS domain S-box-containing protein
MLFFEKMKMRLNTLLIIMCLAISLIPIGIIGGIQGFQSTTMMLIGLIAVVTFIVSLIISYLISRPIEKLTRNIDGISKGKLDVRLENSEIYEINKLIASLNRVMASLKLAIHKVGVKKGEIFEETVKAQEKKEERYIDLIDSINGCAWEIDTQGLYTFCTQNSTHLLGYTPDEMIGKNLFTFAAQGEGEKVKQVFDKAPRKKIVNSFEHCIKCKTGKKRWVTTSFVPFFDDTGNLLGYRGVDLDITQSKATEEELDRLQKELMLIKNRQNPVTTVETSYQAPVTMAIKDTGLEEKWPETGSDAVFLFNENADIVDCTESMHKRLGYTKGEMLSLNMTDFDALESKKDVLDKINLVKKNRSLTFKTIHKRKDGSAILVDESIFYLQDKNIFKCVVKENHPLT